jgi:tripartite-type tricarboxylate transporter receptor subunit TctC
MSDTNPRRQRSSNRRGFLKAAGSLAAVTTVAGCSGDGGSGSGSGDGAATSANPGANYPSDDITFVVPYASGGGFDAYARLMKPYLEEELGVTVQVQNVEGGGGVVGATQVYNADPDGHTITIWDPLDGGFPQVGTDVGYDLSEMTHIGYVTQSPNALTVMSSASADSWSGFTEGIGEVNFATQGRGSVAHINPILLGGITDEFATDAPNFVHYGGTGPALGGLEKGEAGAFMVGTSTSAVKVVNSLDAEMFGVFSGSDHSISGYMEDNGVEVQNYTGDLGIDGMGQYNDLTVFRRFLAGPPGVPEGIQQQQVEAFQNVIDNEDFRADAREAARPLINPAAEPERVSEVIDTTLETLESEPYQGIISNAFGG